MLIFGENQDSKFIQNQSVEIEDFPFIPHRFIISSFITKVYNDKEHSQTSFKHILATTSET